MIVQVLMVVEASVAVVYFVAGSAVVVTVVDLVVAVGRGWGARVVVVLLVAIAWVAVEGVVSAVSAVVAMAALAVRVPGLRE